MTSTKHSNTSSSRHPLLSEPQPQPPQYVVVLPPYPHPHRHRLLRKSWQRGLTCFAISVLFIVAAAYLLWPSDPELSIVRLRLDRLNFHTNPKVSVDVTLDLTVRVRNIDFHSIDYDSLLVAIGYRGMRLGFVTSDGGHIMALGYSYVNATLQLDGVEILSDVILLLEDLDKGAVTFDVVSEMSGRLSLFFFDLPLKTKIPCEVTVNTENEIISRQTCYPETCLCCPTTPATSISQTTTCINPLVLSCSLFYSCCHQLPAGTDQVVNAMPVCNSNRNTVL
ncbi:hypothetical protein ACJIZ3_025493 [Penstemon smallii]|uniref:Late embryogenesis abundant protein LEA-2 subgroup domain-containing protein n=1 Tax=Penstemon smallii TaxID=265156 RepID=A0ABD3TUZ2_9LAMI